MRVETDIQGTQYWKGKMKIRLGDGDPEDVNIYLLTPISLRLWFGIILQSQVGWVKFSWHVFGYEIVGSSWSPVLSD